MHYAPVPMHIPDGLLSLVVALIFWALTAASVALAIFKTNKTLGEKQIPLMGIMAAFIFAAQMLNFPVAGGTSGHFLGGALAAIVLGPWAAILVMTSVIAVQGLLFQDGGLLVMGANIFNMGIVTAIIGFGLYRSVSGNPNKTVRLAFAGAGAWLATVSAALVTALQLWLSGNAHIEIVVPAMLGVHVIIGIGEAVISVAALAFIEQTRPDLLNAEKSAQQGGGGWVWAGILLSLATVLFSPLVSASPDGLERVADNLGFLSQGVSAPYQLLPDYTIPFLGETALSTIAAGAIGALVVLGVVVLIGRNLRKRSAE
ncbi:MAG: cobalamin biosynthesis protein CbiM [Anaerolineae bacterium CG_4_9_14_3_um_filter_57_17]|nr:cobalamin biosynthesis protein CbiM [bacterium]NCT20080.1 cobalamin biosynthesis protein CbiM [bacterium]PJB67097.1 MAG: cobalamin biosynthesis protein CbiM [Anaerolineae bacterium CG_4_9_14_3_um_filter_57_17]